MHKSSHAIALLPPQGPNPALKTDHLGWRQFGTALLLLVTLPVFLTAGVVALAALPAVLLVVGYGQLREIVSAQRRPEPLNRDR